MIPTTDAPKGGPMSAPLPTSPKLVELHDIYVEHPRMYEAVRLVRAAQHAATRKAVLEEVVRMWQTVLVTAHDHDRFGRFLAQLQEEAR